MTAIDVALDPFRAERAVRAPESLRPFNEAGVLGPAEVHVAVRLAELTGEGNDVVVLAAALAARAPRLGSVCVDLDAAERSVAGELADPGPLAGRWPEPTAWRAVVAASPMVGEGEEGPADRPLRLIGTRLYLDRYWREERLVADDLLARTREPVAEPPGDLPARLERLLPMENSEDQRRAATNGLRRRLSIVAGGPGTGKTTVAARMLALLDEAGGGLSVALTALAAPTGKAAARLQEAVHEQATGMDVDPATADRLLALRGVTLHRLLGFRPGSRSRFKHDRRNRLPHAVVVVDEASMVSLPLMARLLEALRDDARLVLLGDPDQLASVEAGAVLGDIVGPAGEAVEGEEAPENPVGDGVTVLRRVHRFGTAIAELADAVRRGDPEAALRSLDRGRAGVAWLPECAAQNADLAPVRQVVLPPASHLVDCARDGNADAALDALDAVRVLCAHRRGPEGAETWNRQVEEWIARSAGLATANTFYPGRPLLVTENDYALRLFNGDTGVVVAGEERASAVFRRGNEPAHVNPARLQAVQTAFAMTVHKSQGSQFGSVVLVLPGPDSPILTRELLYTGITRAKNTVTVVASEESVRAAVERPISRSSGLRQRLWPEGVS